MRWRPIHEENIQTGCCNSIWFLIKIKLEHPRFVAETAIGKKLLRIRLYGLKMGLKWASNKLHLSLIGFMIWLKAETCSKIRPRDSTGCLFNVVPTECV